LCDRAILLEAGAVVEAGAPADVVASYHRRLTFPPATPDEPIEAIKTGVVLTNLSVRDPEHPGALSLRTGGPIAVSIRCRATRPLSGVEFELRYYSADGTTCLATSRTGDGGARLDLQPPGAAIEFTCDALPLKAGAYFLGAVVRDLATAKVLAWWDGETRVHVESGAATGGELHIPHRWRLVQGDGVSGPSASAGPRA
jgi:hypothetical protein